MKKKLLLFFLVFVGLLAETYAQQINITGKITSADDGQPIPGVSVLVKGTQTATQSDSEGNYSIRANSGSTLVFSYIGSVTQEKLVGSTAVINVKMGSDSKGLDEIVVVGYGSQKRANITGAVTTVDTKVLQARPITDVSRGLQGVVPGLTITTASGDLGRDPAIRLRGLRGSLNGGGAQPLILLDNVEIQSLQLLNPDDIESISVLKDAASTSIYGTRAAWGVVLITSKSGKKNAPSKINYTNNLSWSTPTTLQKIAGTVEGAEFALAALQRTNPNTVQPGIVGMYIDQLAIQKMRDWRAQYGGQELDDEMVMGRDFEIRDGKLFFYRPWDPAERYMRKWSPQQNHNLSIAGGSEKTSYNVGLGYLNQEGVLKVNPDQFDRYNISASINSSVNKWIDVRARMFYTNTLKTDPFGFSSATYGPYYYLYRWPAFYPYGTYQGEPFRSAVTETEQANMNRTKTGLSRITAGATFKPLKDLTVDVDYTYSATNERYNTTGGGTRGWDFWAGWPAAVSQNYQPVSYDYTLVSSDQTEVNTGKAFATYNKSFSDHNFKFILGGDIEYFQNGYHSSRRNGLLDPSIGSIAGAIGDQFVTGRDSHWATMGGFSRINYNYKNKYLLELNGRYDGSSRFPRNELWGFFPSASAGWIVTEESFMKPLAKTVSFLKLRGSYGSVGNQDIGTTTASFYPFLPIMSPSSSGWWIGSTNQATIGTPIAISRSLTWETVSTFDVGLDARFFNNALGLTFDWYSRKTTDMLTAGVTLPSTFGAGSPRRNYGEMETRGFELSVDYNHSFDNGFKLNLMATLSDFQDRITKFANTTAIVTGNYEGKNLGEIWGFETDRFFNEGDFSGRDANNRWVLKPGVPSQSRYEAGYFFYGPGDVKYKDLNGDGKIDNGANTVDDHGDLKVIGNSTPRYQYGFRVGANWKGFDLDAFFQGVGKRDFWASGPIFVPGWNPAEASFEHQMDYWTPSNPDAFYPRPAQANTPAEAGPTNNSKNFLVQSKYLLNMAYLRAKNITLGYTIPTRISSKIKIDRIRLYLSGENLFTFSDVGIPIDPEIDYTAEQSDQASFGRVYPYRRTMSFGLQLTL
ncbi:TonB-dependent receptor [Pedobacter yulinensis]|uniref:TonB-dependent receptor n=1 Tax=Pedobacter yulinensis TaxID=2126353 RepID=A0A2T3HPY1_9SPHI|nr:TonB-dependent receptor [Pedobacter yulinensis]PST84502.1 TonB-dependent receptor [Pedobacter yulinensis]